MKATRGIIWIGVMGFATLAAGSARAEAPSKADKEAVAKLCEKIKTTTLKKDWAGLVSTMPPEVVKALGGAKKIEEIASKEYREAEAGGVSIADLTLTPENVIHRGKIHRIVFVRTVSSIRFEGKLNKMNGYLVALSLLDNEEWYAIDGAVMTEERFRAMFKGIAADVKLPKVDE